MVARNPLFAGRWTVKKFNSTVINDIWPEVLFFSLIATMVSLVSKKTTHQLDIPTGLLTVLGTVLGLVISFRTSSAYERYQDGRKMWTNITIGSRNLAQMIWIHVPTERPAHPNDRPLENVIEKKTMINLVQAFSVSLKHFLRGENGVYYEDLFPLVCVLPRYANHGAGPRPNVEMLPLWQASETEEHPFDPNVHANPPSADIIANRGSTPDDKSEASWYHSLTRTKPRRGKFDPEQALPEVFSHRPLKPARDPPKTSLFDFFPIFRLFKWIGRTIMRRSKPAAEIERKRRLAHACESNVPLEIVLFLSSYSNFLIRNTYVSPAIAAGMTANLTLLQDTLSNLERIASTPLPFAYQAHLRLSLWLYLFFLPFQIYATFGWLTIPGTAFASFLLVGFLEIGQEIENPFNYDLNDLDLDDFCLSIQRELHEITAHAAFEPGNFVFGAWNQPFAPSDRRTAADLLRDGGEEYVRPDDLNGKMTNPGMDSIRSTLVRNWRDVDRLTRQH